MKYLELFSLGVRHPYYGGGTCSDFSFVATAGTRSLLNNHRALLRPAPFGLRVIAAVTASGEALVPFAEGARFRFEMQLDNPDFPLFTDLDDFSRKSCPVYAGSDSLDLRLESKLEWGRDRLTVARPGPAETFVLSRPPIAGLEASDFRLEPDGPVAAVTGYDEPDRLLSVDSRNASRGDVFAVDYRVNPRRPRGTFAEVEIVLADDLVNRRKPARPAPEYRISFTPRSARWAYYCVTDRSGALADYRVVHEPPGNGETPLQFGDEFRVDLKANPDESDRIARQLAEQYPAMSRYRLMSSNAIVCREAARKGLKLQVGSSRLPGVLANPSVRNFSTVEIKVGDVRKSQDCLTEVVKIVTDTGV